MNSLRSEPQAGQTGPPRTGGWKRCAVCDEPRKAEIDIALAAGNVSLRRLAVSYGISKSSLARHRAAHPSGLVTLHPAPSEASDAPLMDEALSLVRSCKRSLDFAAASGSLNQVALHHKELRGSLELLSRELMRERERSTATSVLDLAKTDEWVELRTIIARVLEDFPEAYRAVADALAAKEAA